MPNERRWSDEDRELVEHEIAYAERDLDVRAGVAAAVLDALTAAGWRPPPDAYHVDGHDHLYDPADVTLVYRAGDRG